MDSQSLPHKPFTIAICGGGIAGLSLAIGLHRRNIPFHIYEAAHAFAEVGAGVSFGPNSLHAMQLLDPRIRERYEKISTSNGDPAKKGTWFDFRLGCDWRVGANDSSEGDGKGDVQGEKWRNGRKAGDKISELKTTGRDKEVGQSSVHRAAFLDELVSLVPKECVSFNHRVVAIDDLGSKGMKLHFKHGVFARADAAIGCDGVKSLVRRIVLGDDNPAAHPSFTGKYAYRGLIPMEKAVALLGKELAQNSQMYNGYHGHVLTFPIEHGATMNVVAFRTKRDGKWEDNKWVLPMKKDDMEGDFEEWGRSVKDILSLMEKPDVWALFDYPTAETYYKGRICLLGDSAHASTPHQGAGAGMALEDAFVMSNLLALVNDVEGLTKAFAAFDQVRRPRTQKLVTSSREVGCLWDLEGNGIGDNLEKFDADVQVRLNWIWEIELDKHLEEATQILGKVL